MVTIVIGAGVSGLTAAYDLAQAKQDVLVLEARDRIGGRTHTSTDFADFPVELGAELIHGDKVATWDWVRKLGLQTLLWKRDDDTYIRLEDGRFMLISEARAQDPAYGVTRTWEMNFPPPEQDESFETYLQRQNFTPEQLTYVRRSFGNSLGEDIRHVDASAALEEILDEESGKGDFRLVEGYQAFYTALAQGLDIRLNSPVAVVEWDANEHEVSVVTQDGNRYYGSALIVSVPVGVLHKGMIQFKPALPPSKQQALAGIGMGPVIKMIYLFDEPLAEPHIMGIMSAGNPPTWWRPSTGRNTQQTVWTAFLSGDYVRTILQDGESAALAYGLESLRQELGRPDLTPLKARLVNWPQEAFTQGGYSYVKTGHFGAREALAEPTPPLFWAGEASAQYHQAATVHGAHLTGKRAAAEVLAWLQQS